MLMWTNISSKTKATKSPKVRIRRDLFEKNLVRRLMLQTRSRKSTDQLDSCENTITPENESEIRLNLKGPSSG